MNQQEAAILCANAAAGAQVTPEQAKELMSLSRGLMAVILYNLVYHGQHTFIPRDGQKTITITATVGTVQKIRGALLRGQIGQLDEDGEFGEEVGDAGEPAAPPSLPISKRRVSA